MNRNPQDLDPAQGVEHITDPEVADLGRQRFEDEANEARRQGEPGSWYSRAAKAWGQRADELRRDEQEKREW